MVILENGEESLDHRTLKPVVSHKWFDELSRFIELFLHADSEWNLLCIFDIWLVSTAFVLVNNDILLLVLTGKLLEIHFPEYF